MRRVLTLVFILMIALPALAGEGRIPVWGPPGATIPIPADGKYVVTRNIAGPGAVGATIDIAAINVDLDLNGMTIDNVPGTSPVIIITAPAPANVRIHNGTLRGGTECILRPAAGPANKVVIENVRCHDPSGDGFNIDDVDTVVIRNNQLIDIGNTGIDLPTAAFKHGQITHNTIKRTGKGGVAPGEGIHVVLGAAMEISHNQIEVAGSGAFGIGTGILLEGGGASFAVGNMIGENQISDPSSDGIRLRAAKGNKLYNNVIRHAFNDCIELDGSSSDNLILDNVGTDCGFDISPGHGIRVSGSQNHLRTNTFNANQACGIYFTAAAFGNIFGRNMARGNDPGGAGDCLPATAGCLGLLFPPDSCDASGAGNDSALENMIPILF